MRISSKRINYYTSSAASWMLRKLKPALLTKPMIHLVERLHNVIVSSDAQDIFSRFPGKRPFDVVTYNGKDFSPGSFKNRDCYILTDAHCDREIASRLGISIANLDNLSDCQISRSVFYIYFLCDSDALPLLSRIIKAGGQYIPLLEFGKTQYRFIDRSCYNAMRRTWSKRDRVSHLTPIVHENICEALSITRHLKGDYVEIGVFLGGSALTAVNYIEESSKRYGTSTRSVWLLDTYEGFSYDKARRSSDVIWADSHILSGQADTMSYVSETLSDATVPLELVALNICDDPIPAAIGDIAVANIDVDMYDATLDALRKIAGRVVDGGIIICEDAASTPGLYGALQAMTEFLSSEEGNQFTPIFKGGQYFLLKQRRS